MIPIPIDELPTAISTIPDLGQLLKWKLRDWFVGFIVQHKHDPDENEISTAEDEVTLHFTIVGARTLYQKLFDDYGELFSDLIVSIFVSMTCL